MTEVPVKTQHNHAHDLDTAFVAAAEAAEILRARAGADRVREKARADLVTEVDEAAERAIRATIAARHPHDGFVAEELSAARIDTGRRWIVDPVDGTVNYVHGHPFSCISIALVDDEGPAVGVVNAPFLGEVYHAVRGGGAYLNGERIRATGEEDHTSSLIATGFPFRHGKGDPAAYFDVVAKVVLSTHGVRRAGAAALDLAFVACGRVDGFFELGLAPWDVAAGILLVQEAGGRVTGWRGDVEPPIDSGRIIATNGKIHDWLADITAPYAATGGHGRQG